MRIDRQEKSCEVVLSTTTSGLPFRCAIARLTVQEDVQDRRRVDGRDERVMKDDL
jgi:hypothetical protein